ncbi:AfsR/SARP family transcriptional regulator [Actinacidiphila guanduensis]|uniref:Predicted ATPase n=1 Tax=Actinacidiphila guanduensis TaxID=310781 RepID=A0A1H0D9U0_9ACTN|nr:BTAD domain-containing putative transcriptional regulator [Actinacidiphila guanduensis]SDN66932.1 Predicted ATPase [Actinacidiphila guanduensis]
MRYVILGPTQAVRDDGAVVAPAGGRLRALLTALALRPGRVVGSDALIDEVWDGDPPADASGALQALVGRLRRTLGHAAVGSVEGGYRLEAAREDVDLFRFERLAEEGSRALADGDPVKAAGLLGDALALWRGPALADLPDRDTAAVRAEALRLAAQRQWLTAELELGRADRVLPELAALAAAHPLDEPLRALHIRALRAVGRTADALTAYEAVRRVLAEELGADPSPELRALHAELLGAGPVGGDPVPAPAAAAAPGPAPSRPQRRAPGNARARLTSFVGREADLAAVRADLERARLVTITGPGGTGKTRLSQEAGDLAAAKWADGVWYVELAPVSDPATVPEAVISSLGLRETLLHSGSAAEAALAAETKPKDATRQLAAYCASRSLLLVLDNCEHVIDAAADLAGELLAECPDLAVLATSREPLGVPGELVRPLDPLPQSPALRLLADRGAAARPDFSVEEDPAACAELCRRLDGLPLAIELAAARLRSLSPRQLADRLDDRFRLLTGGSRTLLPRQQTLRAVVDWSWDLLEPAERVLLRRLAVFRGGWTLEAVEAVCADPDPAAGGEDLIDAPDAAALLASLVDKSLVLADVGPDGVRHRMLETIAEYAGERLSQSGERAAVEARHMDYFREFARTTDPKLRGSGQLHWFERLEREHENLRAALRRAVAAGDEQQALQLVLGCAWFWEVRNYVSERRNWPAAVAAMGPDPFADTEDALEPLERGPLEDPPPLTPLQLREARRWVRMIEVTAREGEEQWFGDPSLRRLGAAVIDAYPPHLPQSARPPGILRPYGAFFTGDFEQLRRLVNETVEACRIHNRPWELAFSLQLRAKVNNDLTEFIGDSLRDIGESRRLFQQLGDEWGTAETLSAEAEASINSGQWEHAVDCCRQGIAMARKIGSHQYVPVLTVRMGDAMINSGRVEEGERLLREGIEAAAGIGAAADGAAFFGRVLLAVNLGRRDRLPEALALVEKAMADAASVAGAAEGVPGFVTGILKGLKGHLVGKAGEPERGLAMLSEGVDELLSHPLAHVITPRLPIVISPGAVELLTLLAETGLKEAPDAGAVAEGPGTLPPGDGIARRRARRAAALAGAHDRLRPVAVPPAEAAQMADYALRLKAMLGEAQYAAARAEGDGLSVEETVALMRDVA